MLKFYYESIAYTVLYLYDKDILFIVARIDCAIA